MSQRFCRICRFLPRSFELYNQKNTFLLRVSICYLCLTVFLVRVGSTSTLYQYYTDMASTRILCGRRGCGKKVAKGIECVQCKLQFHANCTGLDGDLLKQVNTLFIFQCITCLVQKDLEKRSASFKAGETPVTRGVVTDPQGVTTLGTAQNDSLDNSDDRTISMREDTLSPASGLETREMQEEGHHYPQVISGLKGRITLLESKVAQLQSLLESALPTVSLAKQVNRISDQVLLDTAVKMSQVQTCSKRVIIWGNFQKDLNPSQFARNILKGLINIPSQEKASWLVSKGSKKILGLILEFKSESVVNDLLGQAPKIRRSFQNVRGVSPDKPLHIRRRKTGNNLDHQEKRHTKPYSSPRVSLTRLDIPIDKVPGNSNQEQATLADCPLAQSSPNTSICETDSTGQVTVISLKPETKAVAKKQNTRKSKPVKPAVSIKPQPYGLLGAPPLLQLPRPTSHLSSPSSNRNNKGNKRPPKHANTPTLTAHNPVPFRALSSSTRPPDPRNKGFRQLHLGIARKMPLPSPHPDPLLNLLILLLEWYSNATPQTVLASSTRY